MPEPTPRPSLTSTVYSGRLHLPDHTIELELCRATLAARPQGAALGGLQGHILETWSSNSSQGRAVKWVEADGQPTRRGTGAKACAGRLAKQSRPWEVLRGL